MGYIVKTRLGDQASGISLCDTTDLEFDFGVRGARGNAKMRQKWGAELLLFQACVAKGRRCAIAA